MSEMKKLKNPLAWHEAQPGWWLGKAEARKQLAEQAATAKERDEHLRLRSEYEKEALQCSSR